jgi:hypothetical protein
MEIKNKAYMENSKAKIYDVDAINISLRRLKYANISLPTGRFSLITGTSLKFLLQACRRGKLSASSSLTPTASSITSSLPDNHPKARSANPISLPPKNFFPPRPLSSIILNSSLASFVAFSCSSPTA